MPMTRLMEALHAVVVVEEAELGANLEEVGGEGAERVRRRLQDLDIEDRCAVVCVTALA